MRIALVLWLVMLPGLASAQIDDEPMPSPSAPAPAPSASASPTPSASPSASASASASASPSAPPSTDSTLAIAGVQVADAVLRPRKSALLTPTLKVGFRTFATPDDDLDRDQRWNVGVLEIYPWSDLVRVGLVTQLGFEQPPDGRDTTDFFVTEGLQIGGAYPTRHATPFVTGHVAIGFMRRLGEVMDVAVPAYSALASVGGDVGCDFRVFRGMTLGLSLGAVYQIERRYGADADTREVISDTFTSTALSFAGFVGW